MSMQKPLLEPKVWDKAVNLNGELKEALMNPNTEFMTKLLFDARLFVKKAGKDVAYWSNAIVKLKLLLHEKNTMDEGGIAKETGILAGEAKQLLPYLKNMSEIIEKDGRYELNYSNPFSKMFKTG